MQHGVIVCLLFVNGYLVKGLTPEIDTQQTVLAATGKDAHLECRLLINTNIAMVTWQKYIPNLTQHVATLIEEHGPTVNDGFKHKVEVKDGLQNSSIVIRNVTEEDATCYFCTFNTFPEGAKTDRTCLQVYELHQPVLHVTQSKSPGESLVSCSATGRPAPTVTLTVPQQHLSLSQHNTSTVHNNNNTVSVTTTAVLSGLHDDSTQVGCAVRVLSAPQVEVIQRIAELQQTSADGLGEKSGSDHIWINLTWMIVLGLSVVVLLQSA